MASTYERTCDNMWATCVKYKIEIYDLLLLVYIMEIYSAVIFFKHCSNSKQGSGRSNYTYLYIVLLGIQHFAWQLRWFDLVQASYIIKTWIL